VRALVLSAAAALAAQGQPGAIEGIVTAADGRPLAGASVAIVGAAESARTSLEGRFRLAGVPPGTHTVRAGLDGHGRAERTVEVAPGTTAAVELRLPFLPFSEAVVVSAARAAQRQDESPAQVTVLTREDLQRIPAAALDETLKQVPSFSLFRRTSSLVSHPTTQGVSLRGVGASGTSRTLVRLDGVPHNDPFGNWVYWDSVPQLQVESIEVAPSGLSHLFGSSAMAGVISIVTRPPEARTLALQAQAGSRGSVDAAAFASHARGPWAASLGAGGFRTDGYVLVREEERGAVDVPAASRHATGNWRVEYALAPGVRLFQSGRVFGEERDNGTPLTDNRTRETWLGGGLRAATDEGAWQLDVFGRDNAFDSRFSSVAPDRGSESLSLAQAVDYDERGASAQWSRAKGSGHRLSVGGDARRVEAEDREDVYVPSGSNVRDRRILGRQTVAGAWAQDVITAGSRVVLTLGLRLDHWRNHDASQAETVNADGSTATVVHPDTARTRLTPRAGALVRLNEELALRASAYGGFRAPSLNELYRPFRVGNVVTLANPELGPERLLGGDLGFDHAPSARFQWRVTGFWDRIDDPIANVTTARTAELITRQRQNLGEARVRGVSVEADVTPAGGLRLRGGYVLTDARVVAFAPEPGIEGNRLPQVPGHRASLRLDYVDRRLSVSLRGRFESTRYDDDQNRLPLDGLFVLDLGVERPLGGPLTAFVSVENLFDARYPVQATPVELQGTPFGFHAGLRLDLRPRGPGRPRP